MMRATSNGLDFKLYTLLGLLEYISVKMISDSTFDCSLGIRQY